MTLYICKIRSDVAADAGKPREEIVHDEASGRTRRRAVFNDNLEDEIGDDDDDEEDEEDRIDEEGEDEEEEYEEIKLRPINPKVNVLLRCKRLVYSCVPNIRRIARRNWFTKVQMRKMNCQL